MENERQTQTPVANGIPPVNPPHPETMSQEEKKKTFEGWLCKCGNSYAWFQQRCPDCRMFREQSLRLTEEFQDFDELVQKSKVSKSDALDVLSALNSKGLIERENRETGSFWRKTCSKAK